MKGDFSRQTFDDAKRYSRVLLQQGRVLLDSDWNEQADIQTHYLRMLAGDLFGPFGGGPAVTCGFDIANVKVSDNNTWTANLGKGHYYVDGIPVVLDADQPDVPVTVTSDSLVAPFLVYVDVWEQHVTALEDGLIREAALGTANTATRSKIVYRLRAATLQLRDKPASDDEAGWKAFVYEGRSPRWAAWRDQWHVPLRGRLSAWAKTTDNGRPDEDPCISPPEAKYRGSDNRLYRVEVHDGGPAGTATFKWSRDNGSVTAAWDKTIGDDALIVSGVHDMAHSFSPRQWVELTNDALERDGEPGRFVQLIKIEGDKLTCANGTKISGQLRTRHAKVRRWDSKAAARITEGQEVMLEDGVYIKFAQAEAGKANVYRAGDYWLIPARYATGDVEWPPDTTGAPLPQAPVGVEHHYAPLAVVTPDKNEVINLRRKLSIPIS